MEEVTVVKKKRGRRKKSEIKPTEVKTEQFDPCEFDKDEAICRLNGLLAKQNVKIRFLKAALIELLTDEE